MSRPLRINLVGGWYHVTSRGNERKPIFRAEEDYRHFLDRLAEMTERYRTVLHAYVQMANHYHLLLETPEANLSGAVQWLNVSYSQWFNRRHGRVGHLFQGRFKSVLVDRERWGLELSRYLHLNPIRVRGYALDKGSRKRLQAGVEPESGSELVGDRIKSLRGYGWSSYGAYMGRVAVPQWLTCEVILGRMGGGKRRQRQAYQEYVERGALAGAGISIWEHLRGQVLLGDESFEVQIQGHLKGDEREQASLRALRARVGWEKIVGVVEEIKGEAWMQFRDRRQDWGRDLALWLGRRHAGMKLRELGEKAGGVDYTTAGSAVQRIELGRHHNLELEKAILLAEKQLLIQRCDP